MPNDPIEAYAAGFPDYGNARLEIVTARKAPFNRALRVKTTQRPQNSYSIQLSARTIAPVRKGETLLARFYMRSAGYFFSSAKMEFVFEKAGGDYSKSAMIPFEAGPSWRSFEVPFKAMDSLAAGDAQVNFRLGFDPQTIEIGGIQVLRLEGDVAAHSLSATPLTYAGRGRYAFWRAGAAYRIERLRKGTLTIEVRDSKGQAVPDAQVRLRMRRHACGFGGAVNARYLQTGADSSDKRRYRDEIIRLFNRAVIDNALKWSQWGHQKEWGLQTVDWLRQHSIEVRGHNIIWPGWSHLPDGLRLLEKNPPILRLRVEEHVRSKAAALRGKLAEWDVLNEPVTSRDLMDVLGRESMADWFRWTRETDPGPKLFINEAGILNRSGEDLDQQKEYESTIRFLIEQGAPLDGIGLQAHFDSRLTPPDRVLDILDRFARFGKPLEITEFDIDVGDETLQADYLRDFMTACFSHPAVNGIMLWDFWEGLYPRSKTALLFRKDWSLKPSGQAWQDLVLRQWWTDVEGKTDRRGRFSSRGFLGDYEVLVSADGETRTQNAHLKREGSSMLVTLGPEKGKTVFPSGGKP